MSPLQKTISIPNGCITQYLRYRIKSFINVALFRLPHFDCAHFGRLTSTSSLRQAHFDKLSTPQYIAVHRSTSQYNAQQPLLRLRNISPDASILNLQAHPLSRFTRLKVHWTGKPARFAVPSLRCRLWTSPLRDRSFILMTKGFFEVDSLINFCIISSNEIGLNVE
jgi:hypothetical protein